ncbi:MAG: type IV toxin-antitoxin system AbiEi family antitoxin domain-containing protein [Spirochaetales bacterium]|nr:type IV toxin-antitoxin system AbiEi family antitoxin domain-containing protein [Spirochaetales bacterium]
MEGITINYLKKIEEIIKQQNGTILAADLEIFGIPRTYLQKLISEGKLERCYRGIYVSIDAVEDKMFAMQKKYKKLIYSHETALFIHNLSDRTPFEYSATVPSGYKVVPNIIDKFKIYYVKKELHELGVLSVKSPFGNQIKVYNIERTICDIVKSRNRIDIQILSDALKRYANNKSSDYSLLMDYAKKLNTEIILKNYLEVLL